MRSRNRAYLGIIKQVYKSGAPVDPDMEHGAPDAFTYDVEVCQDGTSIILEQKEPDGRRPTAVEDGEPAVDIRPAALGPCTVFVFGDKFYLHVQESVYFESCDEEMA